MDKVLEFEIFLGRVTQGLLVLEERLADSLAGVEFLVLHVSLAEALLVLPHLLGLTYGLQLQLR